MASGAERYDAGHPGPVFLVLTAVHGNEPAGVVAVQRVLHGLRENRIPLRGVFETRIANPAALEHGVRFVAHDLNRAWSPDRIDALRTKPLETLENEDAAQRVLLSALDETLGRTDDLIFVDLHSTSAPSAPFTCISDTLRSRALARALPVPLLLGIEESIRGSTLDYMEARAAAAIIVEGGAHADPATADCHEAALWLLLVAAGMLDEDEVPDHEAMQRRLRNAARTAPRVVEVTYRHAVTEDDAFEMRPGFRNFDRVKRGQLIARARGGAVRAPASGRLAMPRYQALGDDGFFLVRRVSPWWLDISTAARRVNLGSLLRRLPGVHPHPETPDTVLVDRRVARWWVVQAFHLAGYRRVEGDARWSTFRRRVE